MSGHVPVVLASPRSGGVTNDNPGIRSLIQYSPFHTEINTETIADLSIPLQIHSSQSVLVAHLTFGASNPAPPI